MKYLIVSDIHADPNRQGGTTMESRDALGEWILDSLETVINKVNFDRLIINGDLLDKRHVTDKTLIRLYNILGDTPCILVRGNHEERSMKFGDRCSLELLGEILPKCELVFSEPYQEGLLYIVPHCFDQEEFDKELTKVPDDSTLLLHCNYDNYFAEQADHSLNLSREQAGKLITNGCHIVLGHEHAARDLPGITILSCLHPTSIADCLSGDKRALLWDTEEGFTEIPTWVASEGYIEMDRQSIEITGHRFVRINGICSIVEYPADVKNISQLRKNSDAFIISNNVKVKISETETITAEEVTNFNILELLLERIGEDFREDIKSCI